MIIQIGSKSIPLDFSNDCYVRLRRNVFVKNLLFERGTSVRLEVTKVYKTCLMVTYCDFASFKLNLDDVDFLDPGTERHHDDYERYEVTELPFSYAIRMERQGPFVLHPMNGPRFIVADGDLIDLKTGQYQQFKHWYWDKSIHRQRKRLNEYAELLRNADQDEWAPGLLQKIRELKRKIYDNGWRLPLDCSMPGHVKPLVHGGYRILHLKRYAS